MTFTAKLRVVLMCVGLLVLMSMVVARAKEATNLRAAVAIENATRPSPAASIEDFTSAAAQYWR